ncbi:HWE histidine kinase domain-containing protein [Paracoccus homiensis]|uniref:histidine kinase n=1 Tax=Paracoccus homiensis TaxID=364199 RepID=A0A1I0J322_9RHOB|nr:HWE histidine kinase domain-containing protein [Paracoccus homiensis]SEU04118.1 Two-component sensor histidine kinase, contains HisKA and HATPase domains [Paracoccus homiensis]
MTDDATAFLQGGGQMAAEIARFDWSKTALGPIADWPLTLKIAVGTMVNSAFPKCLCWGPGLMMIYNDGFVPILSRKHPCLGQPFLSVWEETAHSIAPIAERAMAGEATFIEDFEVQTIRSGALENAHFTFCYSPIRDQFGQVQGMLNTVVETSGKVRAEKLSQLRNRELVHRSRNAYALVSALVNQSLRGDRPLPELRDVLLRRIAALVRAQDVLIEGNSATGTLADVARHTLNGFADHRDRLSVSGPDIAIARGQLTTLSLALHELATNATKYGALSVPAGRVTLTWDKQGDDLVLIWRETGGPAARQPDAIGFGSTIIAGALPEAFGGEVTQDFTATGLCVTLTAPIANLTISDETPETEIGQAVPLR